MPEDILSVLGGRLWKARNDCDFTQERLSEHISFSTISLLATHYLSRLQTEPDVGQ